MSLTLPIKFNQGWTNEMYDKYIYEYTQNPNEVLKLHMDGAQGSTTFTDSSPVANTITRHGGAIIDTNNKKFGTGAGLFNGSSDYLQLPYNSHFDFSTGDWTVDSWFNMSNIGGDGATIISKDKYGYTADLGIRIINSTQILSYSHGTTENFIVTVPEMSVNVWYHVALVRYNGTNTFYLNGVAYGTSTMTYTNDSQDYLTIGCASYNNPNLFFNGYIDELKMTHEALWTSNFTPPKHPAEPMPLVAAWSFDKDLLTDDSGNNHTLTNVNNVAKVSGKSNYAASFNGVDNYLTAEDRDNWDFGSNDFTISSWVKFNSFPASGESYNMFRLIGEGTGITGAGGGYHSGWSLVYNITSSPYHIKFTSYDGSTEYVKSFNITLNLYQWYNIVISRKSTNLICYVNGVQIGNIEDVGTTIFNRQTNQGVELGKYIFGNNPSTSYLDGQLDEILILKGQGLLQSDVTDLYNAGNGRFYRTKFNVTHWVANRDGLIGEWLFNSDASDSSDAGNNGTLKNGANITNKVLVLDGIDDYVDIGTITFGSNPFTYSMWFKTSTDTGAFVGGNNYPWGNYNIGFSGGTIGNNGQITSTDHENWTGFTGNKTFDDGQWHLFTITRNASNYNMYIDKTLDITNSNGPAGNIDGGSGFFPLRIGSMYYAPYYYLNGNVSSTRMYNRELSSKEVFDIYDGEINKF